MSYKTGNQIIIVPSGCLANTEINLQCKSPAEAVYYQFSMANRLSATEIIDEVQAQPADINLTVDQITISGQVFKARISGGTMSTKTGIRFLVITRDKSVREFDVILPVAPAGIVGSDDMGSYVIGNTGPVGPRGRAGTITIGKVTASETDGDAQVKNVANNDIDVKLNFVLPRGKQGEKGDAGEITQVLINEADPEQVDAKANIIWLNNDSGDLFKTILVNGQYEWSKSGNLKGNPGSIIYTGDEQPTVKDYYKTGDIYINLSTSELSNFDQNQWIIISRLQGEKGDTGATPIIEIDKTNTLPAGYEATVEAVTDANGNVTLTFGIPRGAPGAKGSDGAPGKDGTSYVNDGKTALNVQSLQLADIQSINITDVADGQIFLNSKNNQLVIKQNNQWVSLNNMSNFEIETSYKINTGTFPINFAPSAFVASKNAVSNATGLTAGYISPDTSKALPTSTTMLVKVDFKISSTDTTDADYYIVGYENALNIRINPNKKTVSAYSAQSKQYEMDYTALGINLHDDKFHTAYFILNNGYQGYTCYAIDGVYFNRGLSSGALYLTNLRVRGDANNTVPANALTVKNIGISSSLPTLVNKQSVITDFTSFEGYYTVLNNSLENQQLTNGILLKSYSVLDSLNTIIPFHLNNNVVMNQSLFNETGLYSGAASITTLTKLDTFTFECYFKYNAMYDTAINARRSVLGNISAFSFGIKSASNSEFTFKNYTNNTEITLVDDIAKDQWHTLAISCKNNMASIFVDGVKKASVPFDFSWGYVYLRALDYNQYIVSENALVIKNISMAVGDAKYYQDYDSSLTPSSPSNNGFFYPLVDGIISNQNDTNPVVKISMNENDSFNLWTVPNDGTPANYSNLIPIKHDYVNQPDYQNVKFSRIFLKDISGSPVRGSV